jgi:hypothetical protein
MLSFAKRKTRGKDDENKKKEGAEVGVDSKLKSNVIIVYLFQC